jgi:hypothetical protein
MLIKKQNSHLNFNSTFIIKFHFLNFGMKFQLPRYPHPWLLIYQHVYCPDHRSGLNSANPERTRNFSASATSLLAGGIRRWPRRSYDLPLYLELYLSNEILAQGSGTSLKTS